MILAEICERIQRLPEGGLVTSENRYDYEYLVTLWNTYRAHYIQETYYKNRRINPVCYQKFYPEYESYFQDSTNCYAKFSVPNVISLDDKSDGFRYLGTDPVLTGQSKAFKRIQSRAWLSTYQNHKVTNPNTDRDVYFLYDGSLQTVELYGKGKFITTPPLVEGLFADPTKIPTFNKEKDQYPIDDDSIPEIEEMIYTAHTRIVEGTVPTPAFAPNPQPKPTKTKR